MIRIYGVLVQHWPAAPGDDTAALLLVLLALAVCALAVWVWEGTRK